MKIASLQVAALARALTWLPLVGVSATAALPAHAADVQLTPAQQLANQIVAAVNLAIANGADVTQAIETTIANAGVSPKVANAALSLAQTALASNTQNAAVISSAFGTVSAIVIAQLASTGPAAFGTSGAGGTIGGPPPSGNGGGGAP